MGNACGSSRNVATEGKFRTFAPLSQDAPHRRIADGTGPEISLSAPSALRMSQPVMPETTSTDNRSLETSLSLSRNFSKASPKPRLIQLLYSSVASSEWSPTELEELAAHAADANQSRSITGALVHFNETFFQVLEGEQEAVMQLYANIEKDQRHKHVCIIRVCDIEMRTFTNWAMRFSSEVNEGSEVNVVIRYLIDTINVSFGIIEKYIPPGVTSFVRQGIDPAEVKAEFGNTVIMVCEVHSLWNKLQESAESLVSSLNMFYSSVAHIVAANGGEVVKYIGTNIICMFETAQVVAALQAGKTVLERVAGKIKSGDAMVVDVRVALTAGAVIRGNIGCSQKYDYTVLGDPVNTASRLAGYKRDEKYSLLLTERALSLLRHHGYTQDDLTSLPNVQLEGKASREQIFEWRYTGTPPDDDSLTSSGVMAPLQKGTRKTGSSPLIRMCYVSQCAKTFSGGDVAAMIEKAAVNNASLGVTGVIMKVDDYFIQILEGVPEVVNTLFQKIKKDPRHYDVTVTAVRDVDSRQFSTWGMRQFALGEATEFVALVSSTMIQTLSTAYKTIEKYVPQTVLRLLVSGQNPSRFDPRVSNQVMLATDLVSFTSISEVLTPHELMALINNMLTVVLECVADHNGTPYKLVGDMVVAQFPVSAAFDAVYAAIDVQNRLKMYRSNPPPDAVEPELMHVGVGLAYGPLLESNIGGRQLDFALVGQTIEDAMECEGWTRMCDKRILINEPMNNILNTLFPSRIDTVKVDMMYGLNSVDIGTWDPFSVKSAIKTRCEAIRTEHSQDTAKNTMPAVERRKRESKAATRVS
eukprot:TRINITY_DN1497_c0_g1_i4.p1 TRINITY_DN1497_c0_g1~~TRINITY_DN1497_c0_g1_i4.p1  ORF type:complete len:811 (+),score=204.69 TRINITY_DN1497_c0_g1_i4:45-2477(+)